MSGATATRRLDGYALHRRVRDDTSLTTSEKALLFCAVARADDDGKVRASLEQLSADARCSTRTAGRAFEDGKPTLAYFRRVVRQTRSVQLWFHLTPVEIRHAANNGVTNGVTTPDTESAVTPDTKSAVTPTPDTVSPTPDTVSDHLPVLQEQQQRARPGRDLDSLARRVASQSGRPVAHCRQWLQGERDKLERRDDVRNHAALLDKIATDWRTESDFKAPTRPPATVQLCDDPDSCPGGFHEWDNPRDHRGLNRWRCPGYLG